MPAQLPPENGAWQQPEYVEDQCQLAIRALTWRSIPDGCEL